MHNDEERTEISKNIAFKPFLGGGWMSTVQRQRAFFAGNGLKNWHYAENFRKRITGFGKTQWGIDRFP